MALLPQEPRQRNAMLAGVAALAALYSFSTFWYAPRVVENDETLARVELIEAQNRRSRVVLAQGGADLNERLAVYERHIARLEQLIPQREEVPALLLQITDAARTNEVVVRNFSPQIADSQEDLAYDRLSYAIEVVGEYHDVGRFLTSIASLPRIMMATGVALSPLPEGATHPDILEMLAPVQARFRIQTFVLKELAPAPLGGDEAPIGGDELPGGDR